MHYTIYLDAASPRRWRWTLFAPNGRKIANSGEAYISYSDCVHAIGLTANSGDASVILSPEAELRLKRLRRLTRGR